MTVSGRGVLCALNRTWLSRPLTTPQVGGYTSRQHR